MMVEIEVHDIKDGIARVELVLNDKEWNIFSTICMRKGTDSCGEPMNGFLFSLVRKSYNRSLQEMIKEKVKCIRLYDGKRDVYAKTKTIIYSFKCK